MVAISTTIPTGEAFLTVNQLKKAQVTFVPSQYDAAVLTAKQVDAIFCFYNHLPVALRTQGIAGIRCCSPTSVTTR